MYNSRHVLHTYSVGLEREQFPQLESKTCFLALKFLRDLIYAPNDKVADIEFQFRHRSCFKSKMFDFRIIILFVNNNEQNVNSYERIQDILSTSLIYQETFTTETHFRCFAIIINLLSINTEAALIFSLT